MSPSNNQDAERLARPAPGMVHAHPELPPPSLPALAPDRPAAPLPATPPEPAPPSPPEPEAPALPEPEAPPFAEPEAPPLPAALPLSLEPDPAHGGTPDAPRRLRWVALRGLAILLAIFLLNECGAAFAPSMAYVAVRTAVVPVGVVVYWCALIVVSLRSRRDTKDLLLVMVCAGAGLGLLLFQWLYAYPSFSSIWSGP